MLLGQLSTANVERLKTLFAKFTPSGWIIPDWLVYLENQLSGSRDSQTKDI